MIYCLQHKDMDKLSRITTYKEYTCFVRQKLKNCHIRGVKSRHPHGTTIYNLHVTNIQNINILFLNLTDSVSTFPRNILQSA